MSFTIKQPKKKGIKPGLLLVFKDSVHFLSNSSDNLVKYDFYHLCQEFNFTKEKIFFPMAAGIALKNSKKDYLVKIIFIIH